MKYWKSGQEDNRVNTKSGRRERSGSRSVVGFEGQVLLVVEKYEALDGTGTLAAVLP